MAERDTAVHAAACLQSAVVAVECLFDFTKVVNAVVYGAVARLFAVYCEECFWIAHNS